MNSAAKKKFMGVEVPDDLKKVNLVTLFICTALGGIVTNSINGIQHSYLKDVLKISDETFGTISGTMMTVAEVAAIVFLTFFGNLSDKKGRKFVVSIGLFFAAIFYALFYYSYDVANLLGINPLFLAYAGRFAIVASVAGTWGTYIIITADYTDEANRAKGMSLNGIFTGFGMLGAMGIFANMPRLIGLRNSFFAVAALSVLTLIFTRLYLVDRIRSHEKHTAKVSDVITALKESPQMIMCYAARFLVMAAIITVGTFIFVWAVNEAKNLNVPAEVAQGKVGMYIGIAGMSAFVGFPIFAIMCDKLGRFKTLSISFALGGLALLSFGFIKNPIGPAILIPMIAFFISQAGMLISSQTLAADLAPKHLTGTLLGGLNTVGQIGAGIFFSIDGIAMDMLGPQSPFMIVGVCLLAIIPWVLGVEGKVKHKT
ncbi:MAG: MFS transporter [Candidatus Schekmanbacteria bacterium]|nr:MFS transporter [Candidatus Schekmanbacteria bacterium]